MQCGALVVRIMMKACRKGRYKTIHAIAAVAAGLRTQRAAVEVTIRLIDSVVEELRWALEHPNFRDQQRTITYARLLGELCCVSQISVLVIFQQLYRIINLGHEIPQALREASERLASGEASGQNAEEESKEQLPVFNSASGVSGAIQEDEEMEDEELETTEEKISEPEQQPVAVSRYSVYDPRVPSPVDPPTSAFRIKLVCTLLEVVAKSIVTRNNLPRLKGFIAAFQRYLFTKSMLATDVEFSLLDTFDILDSHWRRVVKGSQRAAEGGEAKDTGFPRFSSWLEAHNATVAVEESEALLEIQKRASVAAVSSSSIGEMGESIDDDDATTLSMDEEDGEEISLTYTEGNEDEMDLDGDRDDDDYSQSGESEGGDDEESESEGASDEDGDEEEEEEFDEEAYMRQLEEDAFERELRRVTMDALEKGKNASRKQVADYMPSGSQIIKKKTAEAPKSASTGAIPDFFALGGKSGISFQLLKKGNKGKVEAKEFIVPSDTNLAMVATKQDDAAARERDVIKQRVLRYEKESAEAELSGGNVYLEQEKLQVIRNRPLSMDDIDRNFGTSGGNLRAGKAVANPSTAGGRGAPTSAGRGSQTTGGRGSLSSGGRGRGRGQGQGQGRGRGRSNSSGRSLF
jgi:regulator of nonsense transcripts 2